MSELLANFQEVPVQIWVLLTLLVIGTITGTAMVRKSKSQTDKKMNTKMLVLGGMCVALSFILSFIKVFQMPQGGSITLVSMFPIILYSFIAGPIAGMVAGIAYGMLQFLQDAFAAHWISIILDYPLAFACLGLAGFVPMYFKKLSLNAQFTLGIFIAVCGRFIMHVLSGAIFFAEYAPEGVNPWIYSMTYNISYLSIEFILTLILGLLLLSTPIYKSLKTRFVSTY